MSESDSRNRINISCTDTFYQQITSVGASLGLSRSAVVVNTMSTVMPSLLELAAVIQAEKEKTNLECVEIVSMMASAYVKSSEQAAQLSLDMEGGESSGEYRFRKIPTPTKKRKKRQKA